MPRVEFVNDGLAVEVPAGSTILAAALLCGARIGHVCGGAGSCSTCRVVLVSGASNLSPINPNEIAYCLSRGERLACQALVEGDVAVRALEIPPIEPPLP